MDVLIFDLDIFASTLHLYSQEDITLYFGGCADCEQQRQRAIGPQYSLTQHTLSLDTIKDPKDSSPKESNFYLPKGSQEIKVSPIPQLCT